MKLSARNRIGGREMRARARLFAALVAASAMASLTVRAEDMSPAVAIAGQVQHPATLRAADLAKLPQVSVAISFKTGHGQESGHYTGALLWSVLDAAGLANAPGKNTKLRHTILVTGRDGYAVAISEGEVDPDYQGNAIVLATDEDGKTLGGIRLVVPGDHHGGRAVSDAVRIDVR